MLSHLRFLQYFSVARYAKLCHHFSQDYFFLSKLKKNGQIHNFQALNVPVHTVCVFVLSRSTSQFAHLFASLAVHCCICEYNLHVVCHWRLECPFVAQTARQSLCVRHVNLFTYYSIDLSASSYWSLQAAAAVYWQTNAEKGIVWIFDWQAIDSLPLVCSLSLLAYSPS